MIQKSKDDFVFFYGGKSEYSCFSQWGIYPFTINDIVYNCAEQYMMAKKALLFGDDKSYNKIMSSTDPSKQKSIGRKIKNFVKEEWEKIARDVVYDANYAKFSQNEELLKKLKNTGDRIIVEASPVDCIWGVGMSAFDPDITDQDKWKGTNWLGEAIMKVRDTLRKEGKIV
jgi:ribA/ribD-fused uncharacterized protein